MPRGYLKHDKSVNRKARLGGASRHGRGVPAFQRREDADVGRKVKAQVVNISTHIGEEIHDYEGLDENDVFDVFGGRSSREVTPKSTSSKMVSTPRECPVCCEVRPLFHLMKKCDHPPACRASLRTIYIEQAQKDVGNYPLKCYHPSCDRHVRDTQLTAHGLIESDEDLTRHYRLETLAKAYAGGGRVAHCPHCDFPRRIGSGRAMLTAVCRQCSGKYEVAFDWASTTEATIKAVEAFRSDNMGGNSGWAMCPKCRVIISKGAGCSHMRCGVCGHNFDWNFAKKQTEEVHAKAMVLKSAVVQELG